MADQPNGLPASRRPVRKTVIPVDFQEYEGYVPAFASYDPDVAEMLDARAAFRRFLQQLPPLRSRVAEYALLKGWRPAWIAKELGISEGAVRAHTCRARADLRRFVNGLMPVIVFLLVLGMLLAMSGITHLEPTRPPILILPRSQSDEGINLDPYEISECETLPHQETTAPASLRRLSLDVQPVVLSGTGRGQYLATVVITNRAKKGSHPVQLRAVDQVKLRLLTRQGYIVSYGAVAPVTSSLAPISLPPGRHLTVSIALPAMPCVSPETRRLVPLESVYAASVSLNDWSAAPPKLIRVQAVKPKLVLDSLGSQRCTLTDGGVGLNDLSEGLGQHFSVALIPDQRQIAFGGVLGLTARITNTTNRRQGFTQGADGILRLTWPSATTIWLGPGQSAAMHLSIDLAVCGSSIGHAMGEGLYALYPGRIARNDHPDEPFIPWWGGPVIGFMAAAGMDVVPVSTGQDGRILDARAAMVIVSDQAVNRDAARGMP